MRSLPPPIISALFAACFVFRSLSSLSAADATTPRAFRAGAALLDITPELGAPIVGGFNPAPAKNIHDPLYARALVLDDGNHRIAFVVCDNVGIARETCDAAKRI